LGIGKMSDNSVDIDPKTVAAVRSPIAIDALDGLHRFLKKHRPGRVLCMRQSGCWFLFEEVQEVKNGLEKRAEK